MLKVTAIAAVLASAFAAPALAGARGHPEPLPHVLDTEGPEASGCYFSRGRMYCGRYCYWEINGKRYCQRRARDAYPQGEFYLEEAVVPLPPYRRYRQPKRQQQHHYGTSIK